MTILINVKFTLKFSNSERKYVFMSIWKQSGTEFDQQKLMLIKNGGLKIIFLKEYIINNKQLYNDRIINQIDKILID